MEKEEKKNIEVEKEVDTGKKVRKSKWKKRLIIIGSILLVLTIIGCIAYRLVMNYLGDKLVNEMIKSQLNGMLDTGEITIDDLEAIIADNMYESGVPPESDMPSKEPDKTSAEDETTTAEPSSDEEKKDSSGEASSTEPPSGDGEKTSEEAEKPATSEIKSPSTQPEKPVSEGKRAEVVQKAADKIEEGISRDDKDRMLSLIRSKLSSSDITYLAGLLKGGLSGQELSDAYHLAVDRFTPKELEEVRMYWHRYKSQIKRTK